MIERYQTLVISSSGQRSALISATLDSSSNGRPANRLLRHRGKFGHEVALGCGELELVNQEKFALIALVEFPNQKRVQGSGTRIREKRALPLVLLVDYEVKMLELVFGSESYFSVISWKDAVDLRFDGQLLPWATQVKDRFA